jgi:tetratricopeptide (TPR) repeat protein
MAVDVGQRHLSTVMPTQLDRMAPDMIASGRPVQLLGTHPDLADLDLRGHPWARLLVGCALWDADCTDPRARECAMAALRAFRRAGDVRGEGYCCFVLGSWAVTDGDLRGSGQWWDKARQLIGPDTPSSEVALAHRGLAAYAEGRLAEAIAMAEESVALARLRGRPREEATALVNVGFFRLWTGDFEQALAALDTAEDAFGEVPDAFDQYELPLCYGARGGLWALRDEYPRAEADFDRGIAAQQVREPWYEAIVRTLRAEFMAPVDPRRSRQDARWAISQLQARGEHWWLVWATEAAGVAALAAGMPTAAQTALREVLGHDQPPLERACTQLLLGETLLSQAGSDPTPAQEATELLTAAATTFETAGARYWAARAHLRLATAQPTTAARHMAQAKRLATADPAYHRLFSHTSPLRLVAFGPGTVHGADGPIRFRTDNASRAVFLLALAGPHGMNIEQLAGHLWADRVEHSRLLARLRTLLWDIRTGLGPDAWRLRRTGATVSLDLTGVPFDLTDTRTAGRTCLSEARLNTDGLVRQLRQPLLTRWAYDDWVLAEQDHNDQLADQLATPRSA